jgi:hypothetical protein
MTAILKCVKKALKREPGYPVGVPAPLYVDCLCGSHVPITGNANSCACGTVFDEAGWITSNPSSQAC